MSETNQDEASSERLIQSLHDMGPSQSQPLTAVLQELRYLGSARTGLQLLTYFS